MTFGIQYGVVARRPEQGDHPTPGRGQAIAPTMDEPEKSIRSIVGVHPCGRHLDSPVINVTNASLVTAIGTVVMRVIRMVEW